MCDAVAANNHSKAKTKPSNANTNMNAIFDSESVSSVQIAIT